MKRHAGAHSCPHCRHLVVCKILEEGVGVTKVARDFRVTPRTVRKWVRRFRQQGMAGLEEKSSRPHAIPRQLLPPGPALNDALMKLPHSPPSEHGYNRSSWRVRDIKAVLDRQGTVASLNNVRAAIRAAGVRWKKARIALTSKDPDYRAKLDTIKGVLARLSQDEAFFSIDELGPVAVKMRGGRSLQFPGAVRTVPQWQKSRGAFILTAALDLAHNQVTYFFLERKNTDETILLIDLLCDRYSGYRRLYLSWDSAPWHRSARLREYLKGMNDRATTEGGLASRYSLCQPARSFSTSSNPFSVDWLVPSSTTATTRASMTRKQQ